MAKQLSKCEQINFKEWEKKSKKAKNKNDVDTKKMFNELAKLLLKYK